MYYKEEIIDGKYYWKASPNGEWHELSNEELTKKIIALEERVNNLVQQLNKN